MNILEDEMATDELLRQVLKTGKSRDDWIDRTTFCYKDLLREK